MDKDLTARQIYEQAVYEAEKAVEPKKESKLSDFEEFDIEYDVTSPRQSRHVVETKQPRETAADRRNFYRKQAGWPLLKEK